MNYNYENIGKFKGWVLQNFPFIEEDFDALTNYELYCKVVEYLNKVIDNNNLMVQNIEAINNYFNNLDVQEEINNKLDEMVADGTFNEIINQELFTELNNKINNLETEIVSTNNNLSEKIESITSTNVNLMNNIIYDLPEEYKDWYSQGMAISGYVMYIYIEKNDNGKIISFNYRNHTYIGEIDINLAHGADLTIIGNTMYAVKWDESKQLVSIDLTNFNTSNITLNVTENKLAGVSKIDNNNLFITSSTNIGPDFSGIGFYKYNLSTSTLTKLNFVNSNNITTNFYAIQGIVYKNGYLYYIVSNPDQIFKFKVNDTNVDLIGTYKLPTKDNLGLLVGEYESIDIIDNNNMMISSHILDDNLTGRTIKTYIINLENNVPDSSKYYPNLTLIESMNQNDHIIYLQKSLNSTVYYENGTENYPFKSLSRAIVSAINTNNSTISIKNATNNYDIYKLTTLNNFHGSINILGENIEVDVQRILNTDLHITSEQTPNGTDTNSFVKLINYDGAAYGQIVNSNLALFVNLHVENTIYIFKSIIKDVTKIYSTIASGTPIFRLRRNTVYYANTQWSQTNSNNIYFYIHDGATLFINNVFTNKDSWLSTHIQTIGTAYIIIFGGVYK